MRRERLTLPFSMKRLAHLLLVCAVAALCFSQTALAQSGRNQSKKPPAPLPPVDFEPSKPDPSLEPEASKVVPVTSIIVGGYVVHDSDYYRSNDVSLAVKACVNRLRERPVIPDIVKGGKMKREEAMAWAKKERAAYVLWLEIRVRDTGSYGTSISYINYYVFMPQTAAVLTKGQYDPYKQVARINGARVPGVTGPTSTIEQLTAGGQEIADRVRRKLESSPEEQ